MRNAEYLTQRHSGEEHLYLSAERTVTLVHRPSRVASSRAYVFLALQQTRPSLFLARLPLSLSLSLTFFFNGGARPSHSPFLDVFGDRSGAAEFASRVVGDPRGAW